MNSDDLNQVPNSNDGTSLESAFRFAEKGKAGQAGLAVLTAIGEAKTGLACFEVERALDMRHQTASGRITLLRKQLGVIFHDGTTRYNEETNRNCEVYRLVTDEEYARSKDPKCGSCLPQSEFAKTIELTKDDARRILAGDTTKLTRFLGS